MQIESESIRAMYELNIDEEFRRLHIPMVEKKLKRLEQNIYQRGATAQYLSGTDLLLTVISDMTFSTAAIFLSGYIALISPVAPK